MIRKKTIFVFCCCILSFVATSQNIKIRGNIYDSISQMPSSGVEIITLDNSTKAVTDEYGFFSLSVKSLPAKLQVRHMGYQTEEILVSNGKSLKIFLLPKSFDLSAVEIKVNSPEQVMPDKHYHIVDYEFCADRMIVLAYENQSFLTPVLLLIDLNGDTLSRVEVSRPVKLCKDYTGKIFLYTRTLAWAVNFDSNRIILSNPVDITDYDAVNNVILGQSGTHYYLKQIFNDNQQLDYYNYEEVNDTLNCFRTIVDGDNLKRNRKGFYFDGKEEDIRFQQLIMLKPVYAPLICLKDTLFLFNFTESKIEKFDAASHPIEENAISFQNDKNFSKELLVDDAESRVYFLFRKNGISTLKEVDVKNGNIVQSVAIPAFVFVEKIKVHDNVVY
ncbi:MAG: carboxypeptidase-like regulatory domain-containing protein, partial [Bacteroidota bacterium]